MSDKILVQSGNQVLDSTMTPYMRQQDSVFQADHLRPGKIANIFFDDSVVNHVCQKSNLIVLNTKMYIVLKTVGALESGAIGNYLVYQGPSSTASTFSANVDNYFSSNTTIVIKDMVGNFDKKATLYVQNTVSSTLVTSSDMKSVVNADNADVFHPGTPVVVANNNVYMTVISTSGENLLYVDQNFVSVNIGVVSGNILSSFTGEYDKGDIIYQTVDGKAKPEFATYWGRVEMFKNDAGANTLAVTSLSGTLNVDSSEANAVCRIWNSSKKTSHALQARDIKLYDISSGNQIISLKDVNKKVSVSKLSPHNHNSGLLANVRAPSIEGGNQYVYLNSANTATAKDNLIYFTSGTGAGQIRRIVDITGKKATLDSALDVRPDHTSKYSLGNHIVDNNGHVSGIFNIPEEPNFKFKSGHRVFSITDGDTHDDGAATMRAHSHFSPSGKMHLHHMKNSKSKSTPVSKPLPETTSDNLVAPVDPTERASTSVPTQTPVTGTAISSVPRIPLADGLSQTFFTPKPSSNKVSYGMFVTSVDLFFKQKPSVANGSLQLPVTVKIAEVSNGYPTKNYLAVATVKAKDVNVSDAPSTSDATSYTKFKFADPVYLEPDTEYAFSVYSESPEYELYIAELGGQVLGADPPRRISEQPYAGSLFRSQNATTWTPYQNEDIMFVINKAVFNSTGTATFHMDKSPLYQMGVDRSMLHSNELTFPSGLLSYKMKSIWRSNNETESNYTYITPHKMLKYSDVLDQSLNSTSSSYLNSRMVQFGNANSVIVQAEFASSDPDISPVFNKESFSVALYENQINNAPATNRMISITNRGVGYNAAATSGNVVIGSTDDSMNNAAQLYREHYLANNYNIGLYNVSISGGQGSGATAFAVSNTAGDATVDYVVVVNPGSGYIESPTITVANAKATVNVTARAVAFGETGPSGGNILAKYITREINLEDGFESGDLRVFMDAVVPSGTDLVVYYKVLGSEDPDSFGTKNWVRMQKLKNNVSKNTREVVELEYHPDLLVNKLSYVENGIKYPIGGKFKSFAIKVGMISADEAVTPVIKNLRIIATPEG